MKLLLKLKFIFRSPAPETSEIDSSIVSTTEKTVDTAAIDLEEIVRKMERKFQKKEKNYKNHIERLMFRVELMYNQVHDQRIQMEKLEKNRDCYKNRYEEETLVRSKAQKELWENESKLDQEQFKRDQLEHKITQLQKQIDGKKVHFS